MALTDAGAIAVASAICGDGGIDLFNEVYAALGVGDDNTEFATDQIELEAEANSAGESLRKSVDNGYPLRNPDDDGSTDKIRFRVSFDQDEANFHWQEWGVFNSDDEGSGTMLLRVVEDLGTKTNADTWILEVDVTFGT